MLIEFQLINIQTGKTKISAYIEVEEIVSWSTWEVPDDQTPGMVIHRSMKGKTVITLNLKPGMTHWTDESFHSVSARILKARDQDFFADREAALAKLEAPKTSPLAV